MCLCVHSESGLPGVGSQHFIWDDQFDCSVRQWEYSNDFDPAEGSESLGGRIVETDGDKDKPDGGKPMPDGGKPMPDGDKTMPDGDKTMPDGDGSKQPDEDSSPDSGESTDSKSGSEPDPDDDNDMEGPRPFLGDEGGMN